MFEGQVAYKVNLSLTPWYIITDILSKINSSAGAQWNDNFDLLLFEDFTTLSERQQNYIKNLAKKYNWKDISETLYETKKSKVNVLITLLEKYSGKKVILKEWVENQEYEKFYQELVSPNGACKTLEGEILRAISKISYRWYNDGDYFYEGYGIETAGSAYIFLADVINIPEITKLLDLAIGKKESSYSNILDKVVLKIIDYIKSKNGKYTKNSFDMLDYYDDAKEKFGDPNDSYKDDYDDEDDY